MNPMLKRLTTMVLPLVVAAPLYAADSWEVVRNEDGIKVSLSEVEGSNYKMFKGETVISTSVEKVMKSLSRSSSCKLWRFKCGAFISLGDNYYYRVNTLPWPLTDRFVVTRNVRTDNTTMEITYVPVSKLPSKIAQKLPEHDGLVEMQDYSGSWKLEERPKNRVKVTLEIRANPAGSIPAAVVNKGVVDNPFNTLLKMSNYLASGR